MSLGPVILDLADGLELDVPSYELRRDGTAVPLEPQAFDVLHYLVAHRDRVVSKEELMDQVWGGRFVTESAVTSRVKQVRRALGDDGAAQRLVRTVHGRGYRYVGPAGQPAPSPLVAAAPSSSGSGAQAPVRYTVSDGLHIAYQVTGSGPPDIVLISGFLSHLELDWGDPRHAAFLDRLGRIGRLVRFDKRGTGMSDRPRGVPDLETRMHDVLAVMDAVGSGSAVVFGYSEGGAMATLLAATHPERVTALVLYASYAKRTWAEDYPWGQTEDDRVRYTDRLVEEWDWEEDLRLRSPSSDPPMRQWWSRRMRAAATPSTVRALMDMNSLVDVRTLLPSITVPTLVVHRRGDALFGVDEAAYLAEHIPRARLVLLEGADHLPFWDPDQLLDVVEPFVAERSAAVGSTALFAVVAVDGPGAATTLAGLVLAGGKIRSAPDERSVVLFDGPARAVRATLAHVRGRLRAGVALAELPREGTDADGRGTEAALRLAQEAAPGAVWLTVPTRDLLAGSGVGTARAGELWLDADGPTTVFEALHHR